MRFSPSEKNEKLETGSRKTPNVPFTLNEGQKKKIRVHKSVNMDSAVLALNRFLVNVLWIWYAGDFTNKIVTISPGPLKDFFIDPDNLNSLVQLCLSDPLIARIRFVHTAPVKKNIKKGEIYVVLEKSNDLRNFATAHWAWFHRDYLSRKHLEYIRPNENSMNCSTILKSLQFISEIGNDMIILATVDYVDSKGNIHSDLQLSGTFMSPLTY